jgi:hypothetical protein
MARRRDDVDESGEAQRGLCPYEVDHPKIDERLDQLEVRADKQDARVSDVQKGIQAFREDFVIFRTQMKTGIALGVAAGTALGATMNLVFRFVKP